MEAAGRRPRMTLSLMIPRNGTRRLRKLVGTLSLLIGIFRINVIIKKELEFTKEARTCFGSFN
ncbi:GSCOCG00002433001-RA-CDS [Cotesia congregata]|nr:GSCOCG00002433001-RA-CDS [Cotesia congregata]